MAFSATKKARTLAGTLVMEVWAWDAASVTTGTFTCGLSNVFHISSNNEVTEDVGKWTKSGSTITVSGVTSSDTGSVVVIGY